MRNRKKKGQEPHNVASWVMSNQMTYIVQEDQRKNGVS